MPFTGAPRRDDRLTSYDAEQEQIRGAPFDWIDRSGDAYRLHGSRFPHFYLPTGQTRKINAVPAVTSVTNTTSYNAGNKYVPATSVVDSGGLNLTSTFTYDAVGNLQAVAR